VDTRTKIIEPADCPAAAKRIRGEGKRLLLVTGAFDVLHVEHARALNSLAAGDTAVIVAITDPPRPVLGSRARAEMVAALAAVRHVIAAGSGLDRIVELLTPDEVRHHEPDDARRFRALVEHVRRRHSA
jgi:glycerol-3-phosphate cytidylyltransferase-like family protein